MDVTKLERQLNDRFMIRETPRQGGQGIVFRATRLTDAQGNPTEDDVALKVYFGSVQQIRVEREIAAMERIRHPTLANLLECGDVVVDEQPLRYVVCDYIQGESLYERVISRGPISPHLACIVGRDVATALGQIWAHRIVHRDVTPKNVMIRVGDRDAVLIDLGIARHLAEESLTTPGFRLGTAGYTSPEQERGETRLTCLSDIFSLGLVLIFAVTAETIGTPGALRDGLRPAADYLPQAPPKLVALVDSMLRRKPAFRPNPTQLKVEFESLAKMLGDEA